MNLLYANPLALAFHYLGLFFYGTTPLESLHNQFSDSDKKFADVGLEGKDHQVFDFIIVGGGSSGSTLSRRLTEDGNYTVLLLEAGGNPFPLQSIPSLAMHMLNNKNIDYKDKIVPQENACRALKNHGSLFNRGKGLGGGSNLNFMVYQRGNPKDFDNWAAEVKDEQWNFDNVLPYFRKLETYHGEFQNDTYHGKDGPVHIASNNYAPLREEWLSAGLELGFPISDPNGHQIDSFFPFESFTKEGTRFSTHRANIFPVIGRKNLKVQIYSHVKKIQFDSKMKAIGVTYDDKNGRQHFAKASKEIILSAGSLGSPQILMLSGIGPKHDLESLGIPCKVDLPVGQGLQDHVISYIGPFTFDKNKSSIANLDADFNENTLHEYMSKGTGPWSNLGIGGGALTSSSVSNKNNGPDLYYTLIYLNKLTKQSGDFFQQIFDFKPGLLQQYFAKDIGKDAFLVLVALGLPKSQGELKLTSRDPFKRLSIDPKYLNDEKDIQALLEGAQFSLKIVTETEAMKKMNSKLTDTLFPGCEAYSDNKSDYWKCFTKMWSHTMWHYTRVHRTEGLRVVDLSIMPKVPNTNTNLPAVMIAEKAADIIKKFWTTPPVA